MSTDDLLFRLRRRLTGVGMSRLDLCPGDFAEPKAPVSSLRSACDEILHALQDPDPALKALERSFAQAVVKAVRAGVYADAIWGLRRIQSEIQGKPRRPDALLRRIGSQVAGLEAGGLELPASFPALMVVLSLAVPRDYYQTWQQALGVLQENWWLSKPPGKSGPWSRKRKRRRWPKRKRGRKS
jgi:hypothetical protein